MMTKKNTRLAVDLFCGLGGWAEGFLAEGYTVVGFDNGECGRELLKQYPGQCVIQDVLTLHGSQFRSAAVIVASPPCQAYSYRAMPWSRAKALPPPDNKLFEVCFRIQREACAAAGRYIPLVVENVRGAQKWVGRAAWHYGSYYLWGDVPALMPPTFQTKRPGRNFHAFENGLGSSPSFNGAEHETRGLKTIGGVNKRDGHTHTRHLTNQRESDAVKNGGTGTWFNGDTNNPARGGNEFKQPGFQDGMAQHGSRSQARKLASVLIAKIPFPLANHIAKVYAND